MRQSQNKTYIEKYGKSHPMQTPEVIHNFYKSMKESMVVEHALQNKEILEKVKIKSIIKYE